MRCWFCQRVKGKRACPARGGELICSRCCGTKRRVEIRCPEDCPYLHGEHDTHWNHPGREAELARFVTLFRGIREEQLPLLVFLHHLLGLARRDLAGGRLDDTGLLEVVTLLGRTFETLSKGVLYEHRSDSPPLQAVIARLGKLLMERADLDGVPPATDRELAEVLGSIGAAIRRHQTEARDKSYLDLAEQVFRPQLGEAPSLDLTGGAPTGSGGLIVEP